jgi:hypothetical protein
VSRAVLLDSSYLIDLERGTASGKVGPACRFLPSLRRRRLVVSVVTIQGLHLAHARRCAVLQRRVANRLDENDAWLVASALSSFSLDHSTPRQSDHALVSFPTGPRTFSSDHHVVFRFIPRDPGR